MTSDKAYDNAQRIDALVARVGALEGTFPWQTAWKTADLGRPSTTVLANDPDLIIPVVASARYLVFFHLITSGANSASAGFKWDWQIPGTGTLAYEATYTTITPNLVEQENVNSPPAALIAQTTGVANNAPVRGSGLLITNTAGNFALQWAQGTSNATNTWLRAHSFLAIMRVQ
jgi:hypothetical protein